MTSSDHISTPLRTHVAPAYPPSATNSMSSNEILERQHFFHVLLQPDQVILQQEIDSETLSRYIVLVDSLPPQKSSADRDPSAGLYMRLQSRYCVLL